MLQIIGKISAGLKPEVRAVATATSFTEFFNAYPIGESDLKTALLFLGKPKKENEAGNIIGRRTTCNEIAEFCEGDGEIRNAIPAWEAFRSYLQSKCEEFSADTTSKDYGRYTAMIATCERELEELKNS